MKFTLLPLGARFRFEGRIYVKTGPLTASDEAGGQRMIPRYAVLQPVDGAPPPAPPRAARKLDEAAVLAAFQAFHDECAALLESAAMGAPEGQAPRERLDAARRRFLAALD